MRVLPPEERFLRAFVKMPNGCWEWQLSANTKDGYAQFSTSRSTTARAARWAYKTFVGPIPDDLTIEHLCHTQDETCPGGVMDRHRLCVNWEEHLGLLSRAENTRRNRKIQAQLAVTHCPAGHEYTPENTWIYNNMRSCKACAHERYLQRKSASTAASRPPSA